MEKPDFVRVDDQDGNNLDGHRYMENSETHSLTIQNNHPAYDVLKVYPTPTSKPTPRAANATWTPPRKLRGVWTKGP